MAWLPSPIWIVNNQQRATITSCYPLSNKERERERFIERRILYRSRVKKTSFDQCLSPPSSSPPPRGTKGRDFTQQKTTTLMCICNTRKRHGGTVLYYNLQGISWTEIKNRKKKKGKESIVWCLIVIGGYCYCCNCCCCCCSSGVFWSPQEQQLMDRFVII